MTIARQTTKRKYQEELAHSFRRNYLAHIFEGGFYLGGMTFLAADTVMPKMIESLGGPAWLIAFMPPAMFLGLVLPPLLVAHWVERMNRVKPLVLVTGVFQRIPMLLAALALFYWAESRPLTTLVIVAAAPFVGGIIGGISLSAWMELIARTIPVHRRASTWAMRAVVTSAIGVVAGETIRRVLTKYPGPVGYGILHLIAFAFLVLSYIVFTAVREISHETRPPAPHQRLAQNLRSIPAMVRSDRCLRNFAAMRILSTGILVMVPFLSIHALNVLQKDDAYLGTLVLAQMIGGMFGNTLAGGIGDTHGSKVLLIAAGLSLTGVCLAAVVCTSEPAFMAIYFFFGLGTSTGRVGQSTLAIEISPVERRPTYMAFLTTVFFPSMLIAAGLSAVMRQAFNSFWPMAIVAAAMQIGSLLFLMRVREPRKDNGDDERPYHKGREEKKRGKDGSNGDDGFDH